MAHKTTPPSLRDRLRAQLADLKMRLDNGVSGTVRAMGDAAAVLSAGAIDGWTRSPLTGVLSRSVGRWGERHRLFQKRAGGPFYCSVYLTDGRRHVRSLGTTDPAEAPRIVARELDARNGLSTPTAEACREMQSRVTLGRLWERYRREGETFRDNRAKSPG
jgi:hypothetical protein